MNSFDAAANLVSMISDLRASGYDVPDYHKAVALACAALYAQQDIKWGELKEMEAPNADDY